MARRRPPPFPSPLGLAPAAAAGYSLGLLPSAAIAARLATRGATDLRETGSGNPGAANAMAVLGKGWGYGVLAADIAKGAAACVLGRRLAGDVGAHAGGTAAVLGHCFPATHGFRGGKGVAASAGQCLATFPAYFPIDLAVAWGTARWRRQALTATAVASAAWVLGGVLWWRRQWPNGWGPRPSAALPAAASVSSAAILSRFMAART
jgi:glycerol-3-phosphate acyltransferase PlsY